MRGVSNGPGTHAIGKENRDRRGISPAARKIIRAIEIASAGKCIANPRKLGAREPAPPTSTDGYVGVAVPLDPPIRMNGDAIYGAPAVATSAREAHDHARCEQRSPELEAGRQRRVEDQCRHSQHREERQREKREMTQQVSHLDNTPQGMREGTSIPLTRPEDMRFGRAYSRERSSIVSRLEASIVRCTAKRSRTATFV